MKIAVIGAGVSGLSFARELSQSNIHIFEKSRGLGGRAATKRLPWAEVDHGAQYFTARSQAFRQQVSRWLSQGCVDEWQFQPMRFKDRMLLDSKDQSSRFVGKPRMNSFLRTDAEQLAQREIPVKVHTNTQLARLQKTHDSWQLWDSEGKELGNFDWVVLTAPPAQTKLLIPDELALHKAIDDKALRPCWAVALATNGKVADELTGIFGDETISWMSRLSHRPGRRDSQYYDDLWMLHFSADWSEKQGATPAADPVLVAFRWLQQVASAHSPSVKLQLNKHFKHFWRYASLAPDCQAIDEPYLLDSQSRLAVCGDWCAGGRIEGAWISGHELAKRLKKLRRG